MSFADNLQTDGNSSAPEFVSPENGQSVESRHFCSKVKLEGYQSASSDDPIWALKQKLEASSQAPETIQVCRVTIILCDADNDCVDAPQYGSGVQFLRNELDQSKGIGFSVQQELNLLGEPSVNGGWTAKSGYSMDREVMFTKVQVSHYAFVVETFSIAGD